MDESKPHDDLPPDRMDLVLDLVRHVFNLGRGFKVYAPKEVTDNPSILKSDEVVSRLANSKFWLRFVDGREEMLSLAELLTLTYNLICVRAQMDEVNQRGIASGTVQLNFCFAVQEIMKPDHAKQLLTKITFERVRPPKKRRPKRRPPKQR